MASLDDGEAWAGVARHHPDCAWFYTGPLENHPPIVGQLAKTHPLLGNPPSVLRAVRDPLRLHDILVRGGVSVPEVTRDPSTLPRDGSWLAKPIASGGGRGIRPVDDRWIALDEPTYFQKRLSGPSFSALYLADEQSVTCCGVTRQLIGTDCSAFAYCGSVGPWPVSEGLAERLARLGESLVDGFGLSGLFGVDYILVGDIPNLVEVNPRYTASVEVLELSLRRSLVAEWLEVAESLSGEVRPDFVVGKAIVYASHSMTAPDVSDLVEDVIHPFDIPTVTDIPWPGSPIGPGEPILTVFASGPEFNSCMSSLLKLEEEINRRIRAEKPQGTRNDCYDRPSI